jgi:hypothetical protein
MVKFPTMRGMTNAYCDTSCVLCNFHEVLFLLASCLGYCDELVHLEHQLFSARCFLFSTPSIPMNKAYIFFQKSSQVKCDQTFRKIYQQLSYERFYILHVNDF